MVRLSNPYRAALDRATATGTILDYREGPRRAPIFRRAGGRASLRPGGGRIPRLAASDLGKSACFTREPCSALYWGH